MRLFELALRQIDLANIDPHKLAQIIKTHCSEFLPVYLEAGDLYHGTVNESYGDVILGRPHQDRKPRNSNKEIHNLVNLEMKKHGAIVRRDNCYFADHDYITAKMYGKVYSVFPLNGFHYTWSAAKDDIVFRASDGFQHHWLTIKPDIVKKLKDYYYKNKNLHTEEGQNKAQAAYSLLDTLEELPGHFAHALNSWYPILSDLDLSVFSFADYTDFDYNKFLFTYQLHTDEHLDIAINRMHEVWLIGEYIGVKYHSELYPALDDILRQHTGITNFHLSDMDMKDVKGLPTFDSVINSELEEK